MHLTQITISYTYSAELDYKIVRSDGKYKVFLTNSNKTAEITDEVDQKTIGELSFNAIENELAFDKINSIANNFDGDIVSFLSFNIVSLNADKTIKIKMSTKALANHLKNSPETTKFLRAISFRQAKTLRFPILYDGGDDLSLLPWKEENDVLTWFTVSRFIGNS